MKSKMLATIMITPARTKRPCAERARRRHVDEDADEGEDVGVDPERHARRDDRAQREHADAPDEPGEGHDVVCCRYNERFRTAPKTRSVVHADS